MEDFIRAIVIDSRDLEYVLESIKEAKKTKDKDWLKKLKKRKKDLTRGARKFGFIAKTLGFLAMILPYLPYIKKIHDGLEMLVSFFVDTVIELIGALGSWLVNFVCKFIPYVGLFIGWVLGYVIDIIIARTFDEIRLNRIKKDCMRRLKGSPEICEWLCALGKSLHLAVMS